MIGIERCACGSPNCRDYWLTGIGTFVQGSGFKKDEAELIARLLNADRSVEVALLQEAVAHAETKAHPWRDHMIVSTNVVRKLLDSL